MLLCRAHRHITSPGGDDHKDKPIQSVWDAAALGYKRTLGKSHCQFGKKMKKDFHIPLSQRDGKIVASLGQKRPVIFIPVPR